MPVSDTKWDDIMVAVLDTNLVPKKAPFLPPSVNAAFLGTNMVPSMRHNFEGTFLAFQNGVGFATMKLCSIFGGEIAAKF